MFRFNEGFTAALYRLKINAIQLRETVEENKKTNDQVIQDRQYQVNSMFLGFVFIHRSKFVAYCLLGRQHGDLAAHNIGNHAPRSPHCLVTSA